MTSSIYSRHKFHNLITKKAFTLRVKLYSTLNNMNYFRKIVNNFSNVKYFKNTFVTKYWTISESSKRYFRVNVCSHVKMYMEHENLYAYSHLENRGYVTFLKDQQKKYTVAEDFNLNSFLIQDWRVKTPDEILTDFQKVTTYCSHNNICISNTIFDELIDCLTDNVKFFSDEQLELVFLSLKQWPEVQSINTRNFIEVWTALDDECLRRMTKWSFDKVLFYISLMYSQNTVKYSDFCYRALHRLTSKYKQLNVSQLVQTLFYIGIHRKSVHEMHNLEICMNNYLDDFTIDELAIMAMGFFKSKTPIRSRDLIIKVLEKVIHHSNDIHEVSLAALLKIIRYSLKMPVSHEIYRLLNALEPQIPRLSIMCCVHIALLGTTTLSFHEPCLNKISEIIFNNMNKARLKDLERIIFAFGAFNFVPKFSNVFFERLLQELRDSARDSEIRNHGRSYASCISFLSMFQIYPVDLIDKVLSNEFLIQTYGKQLHACGREVLALNNISEIFCNNTRKNYLPPNIATFLAKRYTDYVPSEDYKVSLNITEKMMLDIMNLLKEHRGGEEYVCGDHIVTHHQRGDIIICNDQNGVPLPISEFFPVKQFGLIPRPPNNNLWIVLIIGGRNVMIKDTNTPNGTIISKSHELKALGYYPAIVLWKHWITLKNSEERYNYLNELMNNAVKN